MHVCLLMPCCHLLGKGWPLGSSLWCLIVTLSLSHWYPGSGVVLDCIDSCSLPLFLILKKVQRRPTRFVCGRFHNTSSATEMLEDLDWPLLQVRRLRTKLIMFYKIIHYQMAIYPSDLLRPVDTRMRHSNPNCYGQIQTKKTHLQILFLSPGHITMEPTPIICCYFWYSWELQNRTHCSSTYPHPKVRV